MHLFLQTTTPATIPTNPRTNPPACPNLSAPPVNVAPGDFTPVPVGAGSVALPIGYEGVAVGIVVLRVGKDAETTGTDVVRIGFDAETTGRELLGTGFDAETGGADGVVAGLPVELAGMAMPLRAAQADSSSFCW